ncbi:MAG: prepilin-type N-terminal cleavage/methylation domain-containing protein [Methylococcaceae bacterium]
MINPKKNNQQGFTLIEVLIAMSLLGIMMVLLFSSLRTCVRNWDAGEEKMIKVSRMSSVQHFFRTRLSEVKPMMDDFSGDDDESVFAFQGTEETLQFVSSLPASSGRQGLQLFNVGLKSASRSGSSSLYVNLTPFLPTANDEEWAEDEVIVLEGVDQIKFSYLGSESLNEEPEWLEDWEEKFKLPMLIKISISLADETIWPDMYIAPKSTQGPANGNPFGVVNDQFAF